MDNLVLALLAINIGGALVIAGAVASYLHWYAKEDAESVMTLSAFAFMAAMCFLMLGIAVLKWYDPATWT